MNPRWSSHRADFVFRFCVKLASFPAVQGSGHNHGESVRRGANGCRAPPDRHIAPTRCLHGFRVSLVGVGRCIFYTIVCKRFDRRRSCRLRSAERERFNLLYAVFFNSPKIDKLHARNKLPIVVGGTNYYIEALLWKILVTDPEDATPRFRPGVADNNEHESSSQELHDKLKLLDPDMARRLHPHNKRKILRWSIDRVAESRFFLSWSSFAWMSFDFHVLVTRYSSRNFTFWRFKRKMSCETRLRFIWAVSILVVRFFPSKYRSLEVLRHVGRKHSDILKEQQSSKGGSSSGGPMRYENATVLWLQCDQVKLDWQFRSAPATKPCRD